MIQEEALRCSVFRIVEFLQLRGIHGAISVLLAGSDVDDLNTAAFTTLLSTYIHHLSTSTVPTLASTSLRAGHTTYKERWSACKKISDVHVQVLVYLAVCQWSTVFTVSITTLKQGAYTTYSTIPASQSRSVMASKAKNPSYNFSTTYHTCSSGN